MKQKYPKIDDSGNWFSYGYKKESSQVYSTWRWENMFKWHCVSRSYAYKDFDLSKMENFQGYTTMHKLDILYLFKL